MDVRKRKRKRNGRCPEESITKKEYDRLPAAEKELYQRKCRSCDGKKEDYVKKNDKNFAYTKRDGKKVLGKTCPKHSGEKNEKQKHIREVHQFVKDQLEEKGIPLDENLSKEELEQKFGLYVRNDHFETLIKQGDIKGIKEICDEDNRLIYNFRNSHGYPALQVAILEKQKTCVEYFVRQAKKEERLDLLLQGKAKNGSTALHKAAYVKDEDDILKYLCSSILEYDKSIIFSRTNGGWLAIHNASNQGNEEKVKYLARIMLENRGDDDIGDDVDHSAFDEFLEPTKGKYFRKEHKEMIEKAFEEGYKEMIEKANEEASLIDEEASLTSSSLIDNLSCLDYVDYNLL